MPRGETTSRYPYPCVDPPASLTGVLIVVFPVSRVSFLVTRKYVASSNHVASLCAMTRYSIVGNPWLQHIQCTYSMRQHIIEMMRSN